MSDIQNVCPVCNEPAKVVNAQGTYGKFVVCVSCGRYIISDSLIINYQFSNKKHLLAGYLYETNRSNSGQAININEKNIASYYNNEIVPKTSIQRIEKLLASLYRISDEFGHEFVLPNNDLPFQIAYGRDSNELFEMIKTLVSLKYVILNNSSFTLTINGMNKAEDILTKKINSTKVFVAMGFCPDLLEALEKAIKPAADYHHFNAFIVSDVEHNGDINDKIISGIKTSKFVIVDFTYNNHGAYFEAGYAQGRGLEVIRTCKKEWFDGVDEKGIKNHLHFDINHYNFILWENHDDLKEKLINRIGATIL